MINKIYAKVILKPSFHLHRGKLQNFGQTTRVSKLYIPSSVCCTLILCRHKTMSEVEGLTGCQKIEEQKDGMTKG